MEVIVFKNIVGLLAIVCVITALLLLICPDWFKRINNYLKIWISTRKFMKPLEVPKYVDDQIFAKHNILGILLLVITAIFACMYIRL